MKHFPMIPMLAVAGLLAGCQALPGGPGSMSPVSVPAAAALRRAGPASQPWIPAAGETYQIQYDGNIDTGIDAQIFDLDAYDTTAAQVAALHKSGHRVVCYVDVGTWENWRPDAKQFPKIVLGKPDGGWPGERWLDIRQTAILEPLMVQRFDLCKSKGFDAVDPDNLDGYENPTGFPLTGTEQLTYDTWVATAVHALGIGVAQKNDNDQTAQLSKVFDFAVVEQCYVQHFCGQYAVYTQRNALVVDVEYGLSQTRFLQRTCKVDAHYDESGILKHLSLNAWIVPCPHTAGKALSRR